MFDTLQQIQNQIAADFDITASAGTGSNEWARRLVLINRYEYLWSEYKQGKWRSLIKTLNLQTTPGQDYVALPSTYKPSGLILPLSGYLTIDGSSYRVINVEEKSAYDSAEPVVWITGSPAEGYRINVQPTPAGTKSFSLFHYTNDLATDTTGAVEKPVMALADDRTKCTAPLYIVYNVIADLYINDNGDMNKADSFRSRGEQTLALAAAEDAAGDQNQIYVIPDAMDYRGYEPVGGQDSTYYFTT